MRQLFICIVIILTFQVPLAMGAEQLGAVEKALNPTGYTAVGFVLGVGGTLVWQYIWKRYLRAVVMPIWEGFRRLIGR